MFIGFSSTKKMLEWVKDRKDSGLAPQQEQITWGSFWARFDKYPVIEYGYVFNEAEWLAHLIAQDHDSLTATEALAYLRERHDDGYMFSRWHSREKPEGEPGEVHVSEVWPIEDRVFAAAEQARWHHGMMRLGDQVNLSISYEEWKHRA